MAVSYSGNLFGVLGGASLSFSFGISLPDSGSGFQLFFSGEFDPMAGLGLNAGTGVGGSLGHAPGPFASGLSANSTGVHTESGAGLAYGGSLGQTALPDGTTSTSVSASGPPLPALKVGAYSGVGPAYSAQLATPQLGCN